MTDNLGFSLGMQAQPERYENIYMSAFKQKGAEQAAAAQAKKADDEAFKKFASDINVDTNLYHKSQEKQVRGLMSGYLQKIENYRKEYPNTWQNYIPQLRNDLKIEADKMKLQAENIKQLMNIPTEKQTKAQKKLIQMYNEGEDVRVFTDPLESVSVTPDGYVNVKYTINPSRANIQGEIAKKINQYKTEYIGRIQQMGLGEDIVTKYSKTQLPRTIAEAKTLQKQYGLTDIPPSVESVVGDALISDRELIESAQEYLRPELEDIHTKSIAQNWTPEQTTKEGAKVLNDYFMNLAQPNVTQSVSIKGKPSDGGGLNINIGSGTGNTKNWNFAVADTKGDLRTKLEAALKAHKERVSQIPNLPAEKAQKTENETIDTFFPELSKLQTDKKIMFFEHKNTLENKVQSIPIDGKLRFVIPIAYVTNVDGSGAEFLGVDDDNKEVRVPLTDAIDQKLRTVMDNTSPIEMLQQFGVKPQIGKKPTAPTSVGGKAKPISITNYSYEQQQGIKAVMKKNGIDEATAIQALIKAGKLK